MASKLPPIDFSEDVEKYEAKTFTQTLNFTKCKHKQIKYENGELRCDCGVAYSGSRLDELYRLLIQQD